LNVRILLAGIALAAIGLAAGGTSIASVPRASAATTLTLNVGGGGSGVAANDFFPDAITVHQGDTVHFVNPYNEIHTTTFVPAGQASADFLVPGPNGPPQLMFNPLAANPTFSGSGAVTFDPTKYYNSGLMQKGDAADVKFSKTGTYTFVCLVHGSIDANGNVHGMALTVKVVGTSTGGADTQSALDSRGAAQRDALINEGKQAATGAVAVQTIQPDGTSHWAAKIGLSIPDADVMQFLPQNISIKTGDTVEWTNDSIAPHTVSFTSGAADPPLLNPQPQPSGPPLLIVNPQVLLPAGGNTYDGTGYVNSGILQQGTPLGTKFSLTFTKPGVYTYKCLLHADQGMVGTITVTGAPPPAPTPTAAAVGVVAAPSTGTGPGSGSEGSWLPALAALAVLGAITAAAGVALGRWRIEA
jgi:plastocyanin